VARYVRPDEMHQAFNFAYLLTPWRAADLRRVIEDSLCANDAVGAPTTWVLSNHDVVRHASRLGLAVPGSRPNGIGHGDEQPDEALGLRRARAATLLMLGLPGSAYLYQGEELGLEEVDVPAEARQDPVWFRTGKAGRDGARVPLPWRGNRPPYGFGPAGTTPWLPMPDDWARLTVAAQRKDPHSTWSFYRDALRARRRLGAVRAVGDEVELVDGRATVLEVRRGPLTVVCNCGTRPVRLPTGDVVIASGPLDGSLLPPDTSAWVAPTAR
jgi:alpha-glucosidase